MDKTNEENNQLAEAKPYSAIPCPYTWPIIGHSYLFLPFVGSYNIQDLPNAIRDLLKKLGPIFKLNFFGKEIVFTVNADDARQMFHREGMYPARPSFEALYYIRKSTYGCPGVIPCNGPEWLQLRHKINVIMRTDMLRKYQNKHEQIAQDFVQYVLEETRETDGLLEDIYGHLAKYSVEAISALSPGKSADCFTNSAKAQKLIDMNNVFMDNLYITLMGAPIWKWWATEPYNKLKTSEAYMTQYVKDILETVSAEESFEDEHPFLFELKRITESDEEFVILATEVFMGGIDATTITLSFALHYFAHNQDIQKLARESVCVTHVDDTNTNVAKEDRWRFLKACVKETLRLSPTANGTTRYLANDCVMSGYLIPKGVQVVAYVEAMSRMEEYYPEADKFLPQRWLEDWSENKHKYVSIPFSQGRRMCPGVKFAEQEMVILLEKLLQNFHIEPCCRKDIGTVQRMNMVPEIPIHVRFVPLNTL